MLKSIFSFFFFIFCSISTFSQVNMSDTMLVEDLFSNSKTTKSSTAKSSIAKSSDSLINFNIIKDNQSISYTRFIFALFVVSAMMFIFYIFVKKRYGTKVAIKTAENLDVLEVMNLGANKLYIVRAGNKVLVVGSGTAGLTLIHKFDKNETIDLLSSYDEGMDGTTSGKFSDILNNFLDKYKEKK